MAIHSRLKVPQCDFSQPEGERGTRSQSHGRLNTHTQIPSHHADTCKRLRANRCHLRQEAISSSFALFIIFSPSIKKSYDSAFTFRAFSRRLCLKRPTTIHTHIQTPTEESTMQGSHASSLGAVRVRCLAQGRQLGAGDRTSDFPVTFQPAIPPELLPP